MDRVLTVVGRRIEAVAAEELIRTDDQSPVVGSQEQVEGVCLSRGKLEDQSQSRPAGSAAYHAPGCV